MPLVVPNVFQLGLLTSQRPQIKQGICASLRTTSSGFLKLVGEGFGVLIQIYPHSVQAGLISMKPEPIHYVCFDGAQAETPPLQSTPGLMYVHKLECISKWRKGSVMQQALAIGSEKEC